MIVVDRGRCRLYELFAAYPEDGGARWRAGSGAIWNLRSNRLRPAGWTSADAAGLPILPGLARYHEVRRGGIDHALRVTAPETRREYIYPARHFASDSDDPNLPAMGQRFRLKAGYDISGFPRQARVILKALKRYGMIMSDNGSSWFITGAPHRGWNNEELNALKQVQGSAFEVVDTSALPARAAETWRHSGDLNQGMGEAAAAVSNGIVQLFARTRARADESQDVHARRPSRRHRARGQPRDRRADPRRRASRALVRDVRLTFQEAMADEFKGVVERADSAARWWPTASQITFRPDIGFEVFVLADRPE